MRNLLAVPCLMLLMACGDSSSASDGGAGTGDAGGVDAMPTADAAPPPGNRMFVTTQTLALGSGGLAQADAFCMAQAAEQAIPGTFVAWLSTSTVDARDRLAGSSGWRRVDGKPFANSPADIAAGRIFYPPSIDQEGATRRQNVATGTNADGTAAADTCSDWTGAGSYRRGFSGATTASWSTTDSVQCATAAHFYCFETGKNVDVTPSPPAAGRRVFVSATTWTPGGGLAAADAICQAEADGAGQAGTFVALLATDAALASSRLTDGDAWIRADGVALASSAAAVIDGMLDAPINVTLAGDYVSGPVWLGSSGAACTDWMDTSGAGSTAKAELPPVANGGSGCDMALPLLCFQQ